MRTPGHTLFLPASLQQSFSEIPIRLKLPGVEARKFEENRILLLDWLQKTNHKWLLIFDNAEDSELLFRYWPIANKGCALITIRNHFLAFDPGEDGIEVLPFDLEYGSRFILHLLSIDVATDLTSQEAKSATELSERLSGHALAISQMAGLIYRRSWPIKEFLAIYDRNTQKVLGMPGRNSLDAVWKLSFESLNERCVACLGVLAYITPDSIPQALFEVSDLLFLPKSLAYSSDALQFSEVLETLLTLAPIKRDSTTRTLSLHSLVPSKFKYFLNKANRQRAFEDAVQLLYNGFPQSDAKKGQLYDRWTQCLLYSQHALSLKNNFRKAAKSEEPLKPNMFFCKLLKSLGRFLLESASYEELENVLQLAGSALKCWMLTKRTTTFLQTFALLYDWTHVDSSRISRQGVSQIEASS